MQAIPTTRDAFTPPRTFCVPPHLHRDHAAGKLDKDIPEVRVSVSGEEGQGRGESNGEDGTTVEAELMLNRFTTTLYVSSLMRTART